MGIILSLTGPSGAGKSTIAKCLLELPGAFLVPSNTTREPRDDDEDEYTYYHRNPEALRALEDQGQLAWYIPHKGNYYATKRADLNRAVRDGDALGILVLVPQVLPKLRNYLDEQNSPSWLPVFVPQPPRPVLEERLSPERLAEIDDAWNKEAGWQEMAELFVPGIHVVNNDGSLDETIAHIRDLLP